MRRCLQLAALGAGNVAPNPMVGAVLVYEHRIIGEGYHRAFGTWHAEVECLKSVAEEDRELISKSTLYVSLEPCAHFGKTPPCADLIIEEKIPAVVIGCRDPFSQVKGRGIEKLLAAGVEVSENVLEKECEAMNKRFFTFHTEHRPYIILKWAETANGKINNTGNKRLLISNEYSNRIVHKWRSEEMAILVGTNTALMDNPNLSTRLWNGKNPIRLVIDKELKLVDSLNLFNGKSRTVVLNFLKHDEEGLVQYYQVSPDTELVFQVVNALYQMQINSVIVEGGAYLLQSFIDSEMWDEARVIKNELLYVDEGLQAPLLSKHCLVRSEHIFADRITYYHKEKLKD